MDFEKLSGAAERLDDAQRRYFRGPKGKKALSKYHKSEKGKEALAKTQKRYYQQKKNEAEFAKQCVAWLKGHPGKTPEDFIASIGDDHGREDGTNQRGVRQATKDSKQDGPKEDGTRIRTSRVQR